MNGRGDSGKSEAVKKESSKKMSVERIYQKKTQLEHILLRPDTYIGSVEPVTQVRENFDQDQDIQTDIQENVNLTIYNETNFKSETSYWNLESLLQ